MKFLPRSLFTRLVLVLLAGLLLAQMASLAINLYERDALVTRMGGMQAAQRIADIVVLLDGLPAAQRPSIVAVLSSEPLLVRLGGPLLAIDADSGPRAIVFGALLRGLVGDDRDLRVRVDEPGLPAAMPGPPFGHGMAGPGGPGYGAGPGFMHRQAQAAPAFTAQLRLRDGTLALFASRQAPAAGAAPTRMLISLAVLLAAVLALSWLAVRWATRPLAQLADAAEQLGRNIKRKPLAEDGPLEVARAARAFNLMQSRLLHWVGERTRVLAAMSHDLKTPITRLRLRAELLDDDQLRERFARDLEEMEAMVGSTLDYLRGLDNEEPQQAIDILALLESLQADLAEMGGAVSLSGRVVLPYPGKAQGLKRCLGNLLENAVKYGKSAEVVVQDDERELEIVIRDHGPGIPDDQLERVFEPFYRLEESRNRDSGGTGLGLTIARGIAESHGGRLVLANHAAGGLEARLTLPRRSA